jgi:hypothetical protein
VSFHLERDLANVGDYNVTVEYAELLASVVGDFVEASTPTASTPIRASDIRPAIYWRMPTAAPGTMASSIRRSARHRRGALPEMIDLKSFSAGTTR